MVEKQEEIFETTEYNLASYLLVKKYKLLKIEFKTTFAPQTGTFVFERTDSLEEDKNQFWNNDTVGIQDFINSTRRLKHMLNDAMSENGVYKYGLKKNLEK